MILDFPISLIIDTFRICSLAMNTILLAIDYIVRPDSKLLFLVQSCKFGSVYLITF